MKPVDLAKALSKPLRTVIAGAPEGLDALILSELARAASPKPILHLARDDQRVAILADALAFFAPDIEVLEFPAWDCLPYDRVSPASRLVATRLATLSRLLTDQPALPRLVISTVNAAVQRVPPRARIAAASFSARPGNRVPMEGFLGFLQESGFSRSGTVVDPGDFAVRGGIVDLYPPGAAQPVRLDFFGDNLESIRTFDPDSQRSTGQLHGLTIDPANEVMLNEATIARFRTGYAAAFPGTSLSDPLYEAVSAGRRYPGMEHWLPLFYDSLETLFDYLPDAPLSFDQLSEEALASRRAEIEEYYNARIEAKTRENFGAPPYNPLPPERLYLGREALFDSLQSRPVFQLTAFEVPQTATTPVMSVAGRQGRSFAAERAEAGRNVYQAVKLHTEALRKAGKRVLIAAWSEGARDRLETILRDHEVTPLAAVRDWAAARAAAPDVVCLVVLGLESGFETEDFAIIAEQDILGDRLVRRARRHRKATDFIAELQSLTPGDLVVHVEHGIGRFEGLKVIDVQGAPHDCLHLSYAGGDRLFLPVENIELISRYGSTRPGSSSTGWAAARGRPARPSSRSGCGRLPTS